MIISKRTRRGPRILFVLPPFLATPPDGYGGIEAVAASLLPQLEAAGAEVVLTTPEGSSVTVTEKHLLTQPLYRLITASYEEASPPIEEYTARVAKLAWTHRIDVIHDFTGRVSMLNTLAAPLPQPGYPPLIHTLHMPYDQFGQDQAYESLLWHRDLYYTAISKAQVGAAPATVRKRTRTIYNGVNPEDFRPRSKSQRLLIMGRVCSDKGQDRLVKYCVQAGMALDVAGTVAQIGSLKEIEHELANTSATSDKPDFRFFRRLQPFLDGRLIKFWGNAAGRVKSRLMSSARALVMPNRWAEPFGMTAIEAMASGTPVIAMRSGALPELVVHGLTGYLADTFEELCEYLQPKYAAAIDPQACRDHVAANFSAAAVAKQYLDLYQYALRHRRAAASPQPAVAKGTPAYKLIHKL